MGECLPVSPGEGVTDAAAVANLINCLARTRVVCVMRRSRLIYASYVSIFITSCKNETAPLPCLIPLCLLFSLCLRQSVKL